MKKIPTHIRVNGRMYRRADEGPEAEGAIPKTMSDESVLAADMGIPVEELKEYKHPNGKSAYDLVMRYLK